jgi:enamine deaminase RidA (YjgF/YER057c/UK114 family)
MRLDSFAQLQNVHALEASLHCALSRIIQIRSYLEDHPNRPPHPLEVEAITEASRLVARATTRLVQYHLPRP